MQHADNAGTALVQLVGKRFVDVDADSTVNGTR